jgi:hypothetical protein
MTKISLHPTSFRPSPTILRIYLPEPLAYVALFVTVLTGQYLIFQQAVSLAPPAYYADLACERGRCYLYDLLNAGEKKGAFSEAEVEERADVVWGKGIGAAVGRAMFYI